MVTTLERIETPVATELAYVHYITLINRRTGDEQGFEVTTLSDRFADVMREICHQKVIRNLLGYEVYEVLDCNLPF